MYEPDVEMEAVQIGGTEAMPNVRTFWRPHCMKCGWSIEPEPNKSVAEMDAMLHFKNGECLATTGGEPNANAL